MTEKYVPSGMDTMGLDDGTPSDAILDREFAYIAWSDSCRNLFTIERCCRRPHDHDGNHASGFGTARRRWQE